MRRNRLLVLSLSVLLLSILQSPLAGPRGTDRPLKGSLTGELTIDFSWHDEPSECESDVTVIRVAWGNLSHLGAAELSATPCAPPFTGEGYQCTA